MPGLNGPATPPGRGQARLLRLRHALGQTPPGRALKRRLGRSVAIPLAREPDPAALAAAPGERVLPESIRDARLLGDALAWNARNETLADPVPASPPPPGDHPAPQAVQPLRNVLFVSHCDFTGNSALHVYAIATELHRRGLSPVVAVPDNAGSVEDIGRPPFPVLTYAEARTQALVFPDGRPPDLVHAFTPRELVRELTVEVVRRHGCRYIVHLEDDDEVVLSAELGGVDVAALRELPLGELDRIISPRQFHPLRGARFLEQAAGITVLLARLRELAPPAVPVAVVRAGFDEAVLAPARAREEVRRELGLEPDEFAIVYTGNIHLVNLEEMRSLYAAVALLRAEGRRIVLVKTGWGSSVAAAYGFPALGAGLRDLGWIPRAAVPDVLSAADALVQPGGPSPFNDFRFPSKLPEYLASGRPVVLPRTNIGLELRDGNEALVLERGDAREIAEAIARLTEDRELGVRLGAGGRAFALRELRWAASVDALERLQGEIAVADRPAAPAWVLDGADPPVRLVALVPVAPDVAEAEAARSHGVYAFAVSLAAELECGEGTRVHPRLLEPALVEDGSGDERLTRELVERRLAAPLPDHAWFRRLPAPRTDDEVEPYRLWLRKAVLQTAVRASRQEPVVVVDARAVWEHPEARERWLAATASGLGEGVRRFYAARRLDVDEAAAARLVRAT